jgi:epoxyqueuosine reductase QueG
VYHTTQPLSRCFRPTLATRKRACYTLGMEAHPTPDGRAAWTAVKSLVLEAGFDLAGVAPLSVAKAAPAWTQSIVVTALAAMDEAFDYQIFAAYGRERRWHKFAYEILVAKGYQAAGALAGLGIRAEPLLYDDSFSILDLKEAAALARLGVRGLNGLLITPAFGPRVRLGAIFTNAALPPDAPLSEYPCASCTKCWSACPTRALGPDGLDRSRCIAEFAPDEAMVAQQKALLRHLTPRTRRQCISCIAACPIGRQPVGTFYTAD